MAFLSRSRLFGLLLILASLPMDPGTALATTAAASDPTVSPANPGAEAMEARLQRIASALREQGIEGTEGSSIPADAVAWIGWNNGGVGVGWGNGGFGNGGFRNGGWGNGGFRNGGWGNGGFRNGGWGNGGGGFRNFRNW
jgi:rSAM-associated Gly-rich repeat protein